MKLVRSARSMRQKRASLWGASMSGVRDEDQRSRADPLMGEASHGLTAGRTQI
jgi:hypothetical protein